MCPRSSTISPLFLLAHIPSIAVSQTNVQLQAIVPDSPKYIFFFSMGEKKWLSDTSGSGFSLGKTKQAIEIQHLSWESQKAPYTIDSRPVSLKLAVSANFFFLMYMEVLRQLVVAESLQVPCWQQDTEIKSCRSAVNQTRFKT